jgi:hypothetical protein
MKAILYAPPGFSASPYANDGRCGPGRGLMEKIVPDYILGLCVTVACRIHDFMYSIGESLEDKKVADMTLKNNMFRLIEARGGWLKYPRLVLAQGYYVAVSAAGGPAFWAEKDLGGETVEVEV